MAPVSYRDFTGTAADNYERYFVPAIATPVSADLIAAADLRPAQHVLDVACGTGLIARLAASRVGPEGSVTGVDVSPEMVDVARAIPAPEGAPIDWRVGDATALDLPDESFDVVLCQMGLMFMADRAAALAEMRRVLSPGGVLAVSTPGDIQPVLQALETAIVDHVNPDLGAFVRAVFSMNDPEAVATLLRDAGLDSVEARVAPVELDLPEPADFLWQYINLTPLAVFVAQASEQARSAMERQFVEECAPFVDDGRARVVQPMVIARGTR